MQHFTRPKKTIQEEFEYLLSYCSVNVIFVFCFRNPGGLLSRERVMFRRQTFEV